jgi:hypothetical protein
MADPDPVARRHDVDLLRVSAFLLLILYHVGMYYVAGWDWHVKSAHLAHWLEEPMMAVNRWRMELLFLVSGLAVHFLGRRLPPGAFLRQRTARLLVPLAFGMAVVVPVQPYAEALARGAVDPGFLAFLWRYWTRGGFPPGAFTGSEYGWTWNHLWYLPYLWTYTVLLVAAGPLLRARPLAAVRIRFAGLRGAALLCLPALAPFLAATALQDRFPDNHALVGDWYDHAVYGTFFLYGWWLGDDRSAWREYARLWRTSLALAAVALVAYRVGATRWLADGSPEWQVAVVRALRWEYAWLAIAALLGLFHAHLNRPFRWLPYASRAVYPWYVLHQSVIVALAWFGLRPFALGPVAEPALLVAGTVAICAALHHFVILRVPTIGVLFGVPASRRPAATHVARGSLVRPADPSS